MISAIIKVSLPATSQGASLVHSIFIGVLLFKWCEWHAEENEVSPPKFAKLLCALFVFVGLPYYLFRAYGFKQGGIKFLWGLLYFAVFIILTSLTFIITAKLLSIPILL